MSKKSTTEEFIKKANEIHNNKYDYSKVEYVNNYTKVCVICPEHGEFWQKPNHHLQGRGCPKCSHQSFKYSLDEWINKANEVHSNKYDYSKVEYINNHTKICIVCPEHGEFWQDPAAHLCGQGCPKCANISNSNKKIIGSKRFIEMARDIHGNKYDYTKVNYTKSNEKVCIICPKHGEFWQAPSKHLLGQGCPICKEYKMEENVKSFLDNNKISYIYQYHTEWLKNDSGNQLSLDFYLPEYNVSIECQGEQHFKPVDYFGGEIRFLHQKSNDEMKKKICENHNINILYVIEKKIKTNIALYNKNNLILIKDLNVDKIKDASS